MNMETDLVERLKSHYEKYPPAGRMHLEAIEQTRRWEKTGLLRNLDPYPASQISIMLENQRLMKELAPLENKTGFDNGTYDFFVKAPIPAIRRIYDPRFFIGFDIVSVQTLLGPAGLV